MNRPVVRALVALVLALALVVALRLSTAGPGCRRTNARPWGCDGTALLVAGAGLLVLLVAVVAMLRDEGVGRAVVGTVGALVVGTGLTNAVVVAVAPQTPDLLALVLVAVVFGVLVGLWDRLVRGPGP